MDKEETQQTYLIYVQEKPFDWHNPGIRGL